MTQQQKSIMENSQERTSASNFVKRYIHIRNLVMLGHSDISMLSGTVSQCMILWLFLRNITDRIHRTDIFWLMPLIIIVVFGVQFVIGWVWEKKHLIDADCAWKAERTSQINELLKNTRKHEP